MKLGRSDRPARSENGLELLQHRIRTALDGGGIMPRPRKLANGRIIGASRFMFGPLGDILKNRLYIGGGRRNYLCQGVIDAGLDPDRFDCAATLAEAQARGARR